MCGVGGWGADVIFFSFLFIGFTVDVMESGAEKDKMCFCSGEDANAMQMDCRE